MDEAERRIAQFSDVVGLGVGLCSDYGTSADVRPARLPARRRRRRARRSTGASRTEIALNDEPELMFTKRLR